MSELFNKERKPFTPEEVLTIIEKAKSAEVDEKGYLIDEDLESNLSSAVVDIGKQKYFDLGKEVWPFLKSSNEYLLKESVLTLGLKSRLHLPEFRDVAYDIWNNYIEKKIHLGSGELLSLHGALIMRVLSIGEL